MKNKDVVLITGASAGFGHDTARELLKMGYDVYATARRLEPMADLEKMGATLIKVDVTSDDDVKNAVDRIISEKGQIDIVYGNAGYGIYGNIENISLDDLKYQYDVNLFGQARLIQAVLPHMRARKSGRIILTASLMSHLSTAGLGWYASTKHALFAMGTALRQEVRGLGIKVIMIHPGAVKTNFDNVAIKTLDKIDYPDDYKPLMKGFREYIIQSYETCPGPESTVKDMVHAGTARKPKAIYDTTGQARIMKRLIKWLNSSLLDRIVLSMYSRPSHV
ncbi:SDR family NAD(P)-dependent oxidoreductase [Spirochaeta isovalerica]|uniref:NADP-dependent 3-hydroxy acid dehydrogenase YdfG n=1 Tax=Spirochaeta isovalerica TaxID=150 RepID=A0A841R7G6_9SPIO|nr:SDR family NAD(P)-dependent oxidoreductase [Spirochaeta isovalerica]MBB6479795.1 NADP-dependent 3-hydroxy acid dehydrogenase YdfG [Spirochaeta isovalerica]